MTLLLGKIFVSVAVVLGLSWIAEKVNPRIAGILSGMPLGAVLVLFFVGLDLGPAFAAKTALYAIPSTVATMSFAVGYYFTSRLNVRFSPLISAVGGLIPYFITASLLNLITFNLALGVILALCVIIPAAYIFHSHQTNKILKKVPMTWGRLAFRSGMAAASVVVITTIADTVGPQWSGLLIGFPITFLPFLLIIHMTYSGDQVRTIIRNFPMGLIGLLVFLSIATEIIPLVGVNIALLLSMAGALTYLTCLGVVLSKLKPQPAE